MELCKEPTTKSQSISATAVEALGISRPVIKQNANDMGLERLYLRRPC